MSKAYTAQEMREAADFYERNADQVRAKIRSNSILANIHESIAMLRQAADALEELDELKNNHLKKVEAALRCANLIGMDCDREIARMKAQLADAMAREAAKDAEIARLRECLREAVEWSCGNPDENCEDCVAHGGDTPCKCEKWRKALEGGSNG